MDPYLNDIKQYVYPRDTRTLMKTYTEKSYDFPKNPVHFVGNKPFPIPVSTRVDAKNNVA